MRRSALLIVVLLLLGIPAVHAQENVTHTVRPGDNLFRISQQYGVTVDQIVNANAITNAWVIYPGQDLIIPSNAPEAPAVEVEVEVEAAPPVAPEPEAPAEIAADAEPPVYHTVGRGQSLGSIARQYNVSLSELARMNNVLNPDLIYAGQQLLISGVPSADSVTARGMEVGSTNIVTHIVQTGETLVSIGMTYNVSWLTIAQANDIFQVNAIQPGQALTIPGAGVLAGVEHSFIDAEGAPAARVGVGREIIVDLSDSRVYAYDDGRLVRNVLASMGRPATPTVQGSFRAQRKYLSQTMSGPGYNLPGVPYIVYFYAGYALHGTYWHTNWGQQMSSGCVNLPTPEAEWFYNFIEIGTPIHVQA